MTSSSRRRPVLRSGVAIVHRGGGRIQVGCDPERGLVIALPTRVRADEFVSFLGLLADSTSPRHVERQARAIGLDDAEVDSLIDRLSTVDGLTAASPSARMRIRVHGNGPLAHRITPMLRELGMAVTGSVQRPRCGPGPRPTPLESWTEELVVLTDVLAHDPSVISGLMRRKIPHLPAAIRDDVALIGPLVLPGRSTCLRCIDHHRCDRDPGWAAVSGQLVGHLGHGTPAAVNVTAALVLEQVEQIAHGLADAATRPAPQTIDRTLEFRSRPARLRTRQWTPHPLCGCGDER
ncbi:hypothetical protein [Williamsia sp. CHRR-6]|uniref:hypothetical protein n=1 Tax=Williamsia sp. CHRR-6 TaxID=2835871 RepID=UPI001BDAE737|nr:hypothetical protein [Williamsia sp. CHRR-6]MBT0565628.1 hypothetical protein [Williamsia sp. CHRR-6]